MNKKMVREIAEEVMTRAAIVSEMWTGTLYESHISITVDNLRKALAEEDYETAGEIAYRLDELVEQANKEYIS